MFVVNNNVKFSFKVMQTSITASITFWEGPLFMTNTPKKLNISCNFGPKTTDATRYVSSLIYASLKYKK
jgi:hypothetical protein